MLTFGLCTFARLLLLPLLMLLGVPAAVSADDGSEGTCAAGSCTEGESEPLPSEYLRMSVTPQGTHKLWRAGSDVGNPQVSTRLFDKGNTMGTGLWECTPGSWSITRDSTESFLVLKGAATLYDSDGALRVKLRPGVWHTTPAGWSGRWVVEETLRKLFVVTA
uniref:(S)-ureidoglycine aminohydrolase cupin domain-containing protein n=1 Tax=Zooxanthella nutricula TaxID=1333877 RepID=A0A6V0GSL7_9DINO|mmetsp:Transcript_15208/g.45010  ORF Transcript_15208/g.45010 Transcript_15208/m.45010 type:complete len:163 (+) Transcript_15208:72-560(+)